MSSYSAFVLTRNQGRARHVFLIRKPTPGKAISDDTLHELRAYLVEKYNHDLIEVDLEVVEIEDIKKRVRKITTGR